MMPKKSPPKYSCDFETTTDETDCRVWAWVAINIADTDERYYGNSIETFFQFCNDSKKVCYFHNLKFDGEFIISALFKHGYSYSTNSKNLQPYQFSTLISDKGQFYTMSVNFGNSVVKFNDSLKLLPYSVSGIAKGFGLEISKLELDYTAYREKGHVLTQQEKDYITNDALIVAQALKVLFNKGFTKITAGSNAFMFYKKQKGGEKAFRKIFPIPINDEYIRKSYKGGFTYAAPQFQKRPIGAGRVYDVNSLYPSVLHSPYQYPYGEPIYFSGKYETDKEYPLFFQRVICQFELKEKYLPTTQLKGTLGFIPTEYVRSSNGQDIELTLTCTDLALLIEHYNVEDMRYIDGYKYKAAVGLFDEYIDYWFEQKNKAKAEHNAALYQLAKLMLNSLYGKFSTNPKCASKHPYMDDSGIIHYELGSQEEREPVYIAVGAFCTSYARNVTIRAAQKCYDRFLYADTDSLHLVGDYDPENIEIDDYKLGFFKHEGTFDQAKYIRAKLYMEHIRDPHDPPGTEKWKVTGAGMPEATKKHVTITTFEVGQSFPGKLKPKHVAGGIVLTDTPFTIRE